MITIAQTKDHKIISRLNAEVQNLHASLHPEIFKPFDKAAIESALEVFLSDPNCKCYVAKKGDLDIGYVLCFIKETKENAFHHDHKTVYVDQLAVSANQQKTGVGKLLMEQVEKLAKEEKINKIELDHWSSNIAAAKYFRKRGYAICKERLFKSI